MALGKLGFGLMRLPVKSGNPADIDLEQLNQMVDLFLEKGFTYFDTSYVYHNGESERAIRRALVERHDRDSYTLASKLPAFLITSEDQVEKIFAEQLEKCGVEYFDYFLLHNLNKVLYNGMDGKGGVVKTCHMFEHMKEWKESGKIRHLGFSFHDDAETLDEILMDHPEVEFVQIAFNYYDYEAPFIQARKCYEVIRKHNCQMVVMEPVKGGMLAKVPERTREAMKEMHPDLSEASWAIRFAGGFSGVLAVLSGMSNLEQVQDNISYMSDFQPLDQAEHKVLEDAVENYQEQWELKPASMEALSKVTFHALPVSSLIHTYNSCLLQPDPAFAAEHNYLKGQTAKFGRAVQDKLPKETVVLEDGTDITDEVARAEQWLVEHSF